MTKSNPSEELMAERVIRPRRGWVGIDFPELWRYRELFGFLAWKNVLVHYKQTAVGIAWAFIRPFLTMVIFTVIFGKIAKLPSGGIPYPILTFAALLPWQFFSNALSQSSNSLIINPNLISKIYFPRLIIPTSMVLSGALDFLISFAMFVCLMIWYHTIPTILILWLPMFFLLALICSLGFGFWFSALSVKYRDVQHAVPFIVQLGLYVSPVGFSSDIIPEKWRLIYSLNPLVGVIDGFRWSLLGGKSSLHYHGLAISAAVAVLVLITGALYFRKLERTFADVI